MNICTPLINLVFQCFYLCIGTVCLRSLDPLYKVTIQNGPRRLLGHTVFTLYTLVSYGSSEMCSGLGYLTCLRHQLDRQQSHFYTTKIPNTCATCFDLPFNMGICETYRQKFSVCTRMHAKCTKVLSQACYNSNPLCMGDFKCSMRE